jgi:two-component system nitrate/nitrite response regulator NarL
VLTRYTEDKQVAEAIRAGAYGFLLKDTSPDELVQTIHSVYANRLTLPQELTQVLLSSTTMSNESRSIACDLTHRELDMLCCIAQGMSNKQISQSLVHRNLHRALAVSSLMRKLTVENRIQLALYACEHNLT